ncbi:MAG: acyl-CoA desaturase, partial [Methylophilus sp.]
MLKQRITPKVLLNWFDNEAGIDTHSTDYAIDWLRVIPFVLIHLACFALIWVGWSWFAVTFAVFLYAIRMFAITAF